MSNAYSPCPFCGGDDLHVSGGRFLDQVYCTQCDAYGPARTPGHSVAAWNRRAQPAAPAVCPTCSCVSNNLCSDAWHLPKADAAPSVAPEPVAWRWSESNGERWFDWTADWTHHDRAKSLGYRVEYAHPPRAPLTEEQKRDLVKECDLDWQRGFMPLFDGDPTNRYAVLIEAVEAAHGIGGK